MTYILCKAAQTVNISRRPYNDELDASTVVPEMSSAATGSFSSPSTWMLSFAVVPSSAERNMVAIS